MKKITMHCEHCNGVNVYRDATAYWDNENQVWALLGIFDDAECEDCKRETKLQEKEINYEDI